jgi:hypothetical protein
MDGQLALGIPFLVGAVFGLVGAIFLYKGISSLRSTRRFVAGAAQAPGVVVAHEKRWHRKPGGGRQRLAHPVVRFEKPGGETVRFESEIGGSLVPKVGQEVTVLYDPKDPDGAKIKAPLMLWAVPSVFTVLGGVFCLFGLLTLVVLGLVVALS